MCAVVFVFFAVVLFDYSASLLQRGLLSLWCTGFCSGVLAQ